MYDLSRMWGGLTEPGPFAAAAGSLFVIFACCLMGGSALLLAGIAVYKTSPVFLILYMRKWRSFYALALVLYPLQL